MAAQNRWYSRERHRTPSCHKVHHNSESQRLQHSLQGETLGSLNTVFGSFCSGIVEKPGRDGLMESAKEFPLHSAGEMMELRVSHWAFVKNSHHLLCPLSLRRQLFQNSFSNKANVHNSFSSITVDNTFRDYCELPKGNCISKRMYLGPNNSIDSSMQKILMDIL